jgi:FkbM family methyltransferase
MLKNRMSVFYRPYEPEVTALLQKLIGPGMVVYDIGAHIGVHTLYMAKLLNGRGKVYAFEPWPENYTCLASNLRHNGLLNSTVIPVREAVAASDGVAYLASGSSDGRHHLRVEGERADVVAASVSLDSFVRNGHPAPAVVKIDVEGMEAGVIEGGQELLLRAKPVLIIEHHKQQEELARLLKRFSYTLEPLGVRHLYAY